MTRETETGLGPRALSGALGVSMLCLALAGCSGGNSLLSKIDPKYGVSASPRVVADGAPIPKGTGAYRVGKPYKIAGRTYYPAENPNYKAIGTASYYSDAFHGRLTANGEIFDRNSISAAHPTLPMPSYVRVTNLKNDKSIIVRVNNRGPYHGDRIIDVSHKTADLLGFQSSGITQVKVEYVGRAPLEGSDDRVLMASLRDDVPAELPSGSAVMVASATPFVPSLPRAMPATMSEGAVPMPSQRPYDLGHELDREVAQMASTQVPAAPAASSRTTAQAASSFRPVDPAPVRTTFAAVGWSAGAAPVSGLSYSGVSVDGGR
ncbi:septal ring lytic transglycosylase RlpA family protein [Aquabacter cavernae]|uniref:septal ring lytic transglycosylase RlpA family protein n=1 Tax=Aquabacter cavernae TaxID=2496029 RepID=UPI000F8F19DC|nr:septal ring lytic transglycosylase RlpA family protein [Aquabacter cavernae]